AGIAHRRRDWRAAANLFWMDFRNAIVWAGALDDNGVPVYGNGARARHRGFEFDGTWQPGPSLGFDATLTLSRNSFTSYRDLSDPERPAIFDGNCVAGYPDFLASLTARSQLAGIRLNVNLRRVGRMFIDNTEDNRRDPAAREVVGYVPRINPAFTIVNLAGTVSLPALIHTLALTSAHLEVRLNNLFDSRYTAFGYMSDEPLFIPAAGRNVVTTLRLGM
ncbi:MAG: TonB-dependent receptor, partial [Acidobacteria bacterium]|nr:TonB-dependent receptor [Acidobacteriota bacterium]